MPASSLFRRDVYHFFEVVQLTWDLAHVLVRADNYVTWIVRGIDTHGIICFQLRKPDHFILFTQLRNYTTVTTRLFSISMTLVFWVNFFPEILRVTEKQNKLRNIPHELSFDLGQLTLNVF